ncbi:unnamed protein product [Cunninghamella blakesleeana]
MGNFFSKPSLIETSSSLGKRARGEEENNDIVEKRTKVEISPVLEEQVGISAYLQPNLSGFHCIIKNRAEDFLNENTKGLSNEEFDNRIKELFDEEFSTSLRDFLNHPEDISRTISVETTKENRFGLYDLIAGLEKPLKSSVSNGLLTICWPENNDNFNRQVFIDYKALGGEYLQFHVYKSNIDTMGVVNCIAKATKVPTKQMGYAGTKDARAITVQAMTCFRGRPERFELVKEELEKFGVHVGNFEFVPKGLTLGDLGGNHFTIVLRDIQGATEESIAESLNSLKENGFLNYFGMQRFGTSTILTHEIGRSLLRKDFANVADLILMPREGDGFLYDKARSLWKETKDPSATLAIFPKRANSEIKLLKSYERFPNNHEKAVRNLPRAMYTMYCHAYQSYIWNRVVSERAKLFGCSEPLVGDIVMIDSKTDDNDNTNKKNKKSIKANNVGRRDPWNRKVPLILTEDNIKSYTIRDVVYPLPGVHTVYPQNEIGELYKKYMDEDKIKMSKSDKFYQDFPGDYRYMLAIPKDLSWSFARYNDPSAKLFNTDLDNAQGISPPTGDINGKHVGLKVEFTLGTSQYATMALREIIRGETGSKSQAKLIHS